MWPHRRQPTRLPRPWDSPGKNTGVGCHFPLQCMKGKVKVKLLSRVWLLATPWTAAYQAPPSMGFSRQRVLEWVRYTFTYISYISDLGISFLLKENDHFILKYKCEYLIRTWKEITTTTNSEKLTNVTNIPKSKTTILFYYLPDNILFLRTHFLSYPFTRLFQMTIAWERFCNLG